MVCRHGRLMRTTTSAPPRATSSRRSPQVAARPRPLGLRHAVLEVEDDGIGAAPVRAVDELSHVRRHVQQRAPHRQLACRRRRRCHQITFRSRSSGESSSLKPSAPRISSVCSPSSGAGVRSTPGVAESRGTIACIGIAAHLVVRHVDDDLARLHMRIGDELVDVVDRRGGHLRLLEQPRAHRRACAPAMNSRIGASQASALRTRSRVGAKARIVDHVGAADGAEQPLGHRLDRGRDRDPAPVAGLEHIARRACCRAAAQCAAAISPVSLIDRGIGAEDREDRIEQRQVDHLALAAARPRSRAAPSAPPHVP